jgi:CBS domain-containing protein
MISKPLPTFRFPDGTCIPQALAPAARSVTLDSPALWVMTDLTQVRAATVRPDETLGSAEQTMLQHGVRMLFVVAHMPCVDGIVTSASLTGDKPMRLVQQRQVRRAELSVADVMTRLSDLDVVPLEVLERATVGAVAATLRRFGRPHLLVVERATLESAARIRGVISHTQVERQLGSPLPMHEIATTFVEIGQALV